MKSKQRACTGKQHRLFKPCPDAGLGMPYPGDLSDSADRPPGRLVADVCHAPQCGNTCILSSSYSDMSLVTAADNFWKCHVYWIRLIGDFKTFMKKWNEKIKNIFEIHVQLFHNIHSLYSREGLHEAEKLLNSSTKGRVRSYCSAFRLWHKSTEKALPVPSMPSSRWQSLHHAR